MHKKHIQQWISQTAESPACHPPLVPHISKHGERRRNEKSKVPHRSNDGVVAHTAERNKALPAKYEDLERPEQPHLPLSVVMGVGNGSMPQRPTTNRKQKRKRTSSSFSSFLEADTLDTSHAQITHDQQIPRMALVDTARLPRDEDLVYASSSYTDLEDAQLRYQRKPRHRTRDSLYDPISAEQKKMKKKECKGKTAKHTKRLKRQTKKNTPATLLHDFSARNVSGDRLTLKPPRNVGLFKNGRASSPVKGRGLPDLTFSEMSFLQNRKDKNEGKTKVDKTGAREGRDLACRGEVSSYFASAHKVLNEREPNIPNKQAQRKFECREISPRYHESEKIVFNNRYSTASTDGKLRVKPRKGFLGGGTRGSHYNTPSVRPETPSEMDCSEGAEHPGSRRSQKSTTYFTWPRSEPSLKSPVSHSRVAESQVLDHSASQLVTDRTARLMTLDDQKASKHLSSPKATRDAHISFGPPKSPARVIDEIHTRGEQEKESQVEPTCDEPVERVKPLDVERGTREHGMAPPAFKGSAQVDIRRQKRPLSSMTNILQECGNAFPDSSIARPINSPFTVSDPVISAPRPATDVIRSDKRTDTDGLTSNTDPSTSNPPVAHNTDFENATKQPLRCLGASSPKTSSYTYGSRGLYGFHVGEVGNVPSLDLLLQQRYRREISHLRHPSSCTESLYLQPTMFGDQYTASTRTGELPSNILELRTVGLEEVPSDTLPLQEFEPLLPSPTNERSALNRLEYKLGPSKDTYEADTKFGNLDDLNPVLGPGYHDIDLGYYSTRKHEPQRWRYGYTNDIHNTGDSFAWTSEGGPTMYAESVGSAHCPMLGDRSMEEGLVDAGCAFGNVSAVSKDHQAREVGYSARLEESNLKSMQGFWRPHRLY